MISIRVLDSRGAGALCVGLGLLGALAAAQEGGGPAELGPTGRRLHADELLVAPGARGRFGFGLTALEWRAPLRLSLIDEEGREIELAHVDGERHPAFIEERWSGGGLELTERKYITDDDTLIVDCELRESSGERDRELLLRLDGDATPWLERVRSRFDGVDLSRAEPRFRHDARGVSFASGHLVHDEVVFPLSAAVGERGGEVRGVGPSASGESLRLPLPDPRPALGELHLLLSAGASTSPEISFSFEEGPRELLPWPRSDAGALVNQRVRWRRVRLPGSAAILWHLVYEPAPGCFPAALELGGSVEQGALLLAATLEVPPREGRLPVLLGEIPTASGLARVCLAGTLFEAVTDADGKRCLQRFESLPAGGGIAFRAVLAIGPRILPVLAGAVDATIDEHRLAAQRAEYRRWFEDQVPRFSCSEPALERAWAAGWVGLRRRLLLLGEQNYTLPIFREPNADHVELSSLPGLLAQTRWLADLDYVQGPVRAFVIRQQAEGDLPRRLPPGREWGSDRRLPESIVDAWAVKGSELFLRENLPLLERAALEQIESAASTLELAARAAELPALARGRRALGEEQAAVALEERYREVLGAGVELAETAEGEPQWLARIAAAREGSAAPIGDELIRLVGGLRPRDDGRIELRPSYPRLDHFAFEGLSYRGRLLDLYWDRPDGTRIRESIPEGYTLLIDGTQSFHAAELTDVVL